MKIQTALWKMLGGSFVGPPHGTTLATVIINNKNVPLRAAKRLKRKSVGQTDLFRKDKLSSVSLNELAMNEQLFPKRCPLSYLKLT